MVVHQHHAARRHEGFRQQVLRGPALVHRHHVLKAEHFPGGFLQAVKTLAARVGIVRRHHRRQLAVAHRVGAAVGEHIQKDIARAQQKGVEPRGLDGFQALLDGR